MVDGAIANGGVRGEGMTKDDNQKNLWEYYFFLSRERVLAPSSDANPTPPNIS
jgi:hypothetical protein